MSTAEETRTIEIKMDIDAAVGRVWSALTDPERLRQWFPLMAEVDDQTVLRMVHSGFSTAKEWDEEYDAHSRGWLWELTSLANYLGRHDDKERHVAWERQALAVPKDEAWSVLASPQALLAEGSLDGLSPGDPYAITTVHGDRFEGRVLLNQPPTEFAGTIDNMDHSMLRFGIETYLRHPEASFWLSTWGEPSRAEALRVRWRETFDRLFG